jgi:hypothetical protein
LIDIFHNFKLTSAAEKFGRIMMDEQWALSRAGGEKRSHTE